MHEDAAEALLLELRELLAEAFPAHLVVPHPERHGTELRWGIGEIPAHFAG